MNIWSCFRTHLLEKLCDVVHFIMNDNPCAFKRVPFLHLWQSIIFNTLSVCPVVFHCFVFFKCVSICSEGYRNSSMFRSTHVLLYWTYQQLYFPTRQATPIPLKTNSDWMISRSCCLACLFWLDRGLSISSLGLCFSEAHEVTRQKFTKVHESTVLTQYGSVAVYRHHVNLVVSVSQEEVGCP